MFKSTKKYRIAAFLGVVFFTLAICFYIDAKITEDYLNRNERTKGFRSENGYTVVDYDYLQKIGDLEDIPQWIVLSLLGAICFIIYAKRKNIDVDANLYDAKMLYYKNKRKELKYSKKLEKKLTKKLKKLTKKLEIK